MGRDLRGVIIASPGQVRDGLRELLTAVLKLGYVEEVDDPCSALITLVEQQPGLVVLDSAVAGGGLRTILKRIKAEAPQARCLVLADNSEDGQSARVHGADDVLIKGFSAEKFVETIGTILSELGGIGPAN